MGCIAVEADKVKGYSTEQVKDMTKDVMKHPMPGTGLSEMETAYAKAKQEKQLEPNE